MNLKDLSQAERSILLYLEVCATENVGRVDTRRLSEIDKDIIKKWNSMNFIRFGSMRPQNIPSGSTRSLWVKLSKEAWRIAHVLRRYRAVRMENNYPYTRNRWE